MIFRIQIFKIRNNICIFKFSHLIWKNILGGFLNSVICGKEAGLLCVSIVCCVDTGIISQIRVILLPRLIQQSLKLFFFSQLTADFPRSWFKLAICFKFSKRIRFFQGKLNFNYVFCLFFYFFLPVVPCAASVCWTFSWYFFLIIHVTFSAYFNSSQITLMHRFM